MKACSIDLRKKIVDWVRKGVFKSETARRFGVDRSTVKCYVKQLDERGSLAPKKRPGSHPKLDESAMRLLKEDIEAHLRATCRQRSECLVVVRGVEVSDDLPGDQAPGREPKKRSTVASERDEWLRVLWRTEVSTLDPRRLIFVDEMGTHTSLAPLYGYSPRGQRVFFEVPRNRGKNTTLLSSIGSDGMSPSMAVEGPTTKEAFEVYMEHFLAPALSAGEAIIMDNLAAHKGEKIRRIVEERVCERLYLPPYSPDLNPIEESFSKIKRFLRRAGARTKEALVKAIGEAFDVVGARDAGVFRSLRLPWAGAVTVKCGISHLELLFAVRLDSRAPITVSTLRRSAIRWTGHLTSASSSPFSEMGDS